MYAVIATGGKQYKVSEGETVRVEKLGVEAGSKFTFDQVLLVSGDDVKVGNPTVDGASVEATVVGDGKAKKVDVTIGIDAGETIEVKSGIKASDKVVTKGQTYLDDGSKVKVVSDNGTEITEATTEATTENPKAKKSKGENK